jgi:hypothetical protein
MFYNLCMLAVLTEIELGLKTQERRFCLPLKPSNDATLDGLACRSSTGSSSTVKQRENGRKTQC